MESLVLANPLRRLIASLIDIIIISVGTIPITFVTRGNDLASFLSLFVVACCYYVYSIPSLGQKIMNICPVLRCGRPINPLIAFDRIALQFLCPAIAMLLLQIISIADPGGTVVATVLLLHSSVVLLWAYWYVSAVFSSQKQTLHDSLCGTIVIVKRT
ncbi:RDD family protein [Anaplasma phagocytophilum]|uniref:Uncharacterized protein n=6 Tax=Anaplasma phagocytophilum TaxID=948 RepID=A0A098EF68_ANAPH|nr:RDD family protein [Anaplasma phagocytophilum]AGR79222.1 hypothetical protein YYU_00900 [Anaplasma phagocytophilum str. HZ2]AGR80467.1 hypothetical protein WSQ_00890 [Anaplasma phagocytophilum str. JM]AGR81725.1 hypothetical protein YYY_00905 [Anaplasma phagocytophilum str. Dog2]ANC33963.1 hypothetical protein P029_00795 [Anaplasma phagocytophilum str. Norway variant2]KJV64077.1 RDD family protein [Anaplasma phagocytophilum str. ApMUC09]KJV67688.1 RDD family protein [Anaplasma phagocytophi